MDFVFKLVEDIYIIWWWFMTWATWEDNTIEKNALKQ